MNDDRVRVRATVHQAGGPGEPSLRPGDRVLVHPDEPEIQRRIQSGALVLDTAPAELAVPVEREDLGAQDEPEPEPEPEPIPALAVASPGTRDDAASPPAAATAAEDER